MPIGLMLFGIAGCVLRSPSPAEQSPSITDPSSALQPTPSLAASPAAGTDVLLTVVHSGNFGDDRGRVLPVAPELTLFADGLVVANVTELRDRRPTFKAIQLTSGELDAVVERILDAELENVPASTWSREELAGSDGGTTIIRTAFGESSVEIVALGLSPDSSPSLGGGRLSAGVFDVNDLFGELVDAVRTRDGAILDRALPVVHVAPGPLEMDPASRPPA